jgi:MOSC domain-containing protein YiiM
MEPESGAAGGGGVTAGAASQRREVVARLLSVNVGMPRDIQWNGRTVHTGIWKDPQPGRCRVGRLNLDGDGQGDLAGHGSDQRAVFILEPGERPVLTA